MEGIKYTNEIIAFFLYTEFMFQTWRHKRFHVSFTLGLACLCFLLGISVSRFINNYQPASAYTLVILIILCLILFLRIRWYTLIIIATLCLSIGFVHGSNQLTELSKLEAYASKKITLEGKIAEDPQQTERGDMRIVLENISINGAAYKGTVWISTTSDTYKRGDVLVINDTMKSGFGTHQLTATYVHVLRHTASNDPLVDLRDTFANAVRAHIVEPSASLGIGFVVGQKSALPPELEDQLQIVGLTHLVVASGYNLTILIRFAKRIFEKYSKFLVLSSSSALIITFVGLSGASPSMVRASIVAGLSIAAWNYGRRFHPVLLILYVAAITAAINPIYLWADIGWWLSFLAFFGVLVVSPLILSTAKKKPSAFKQLLSETLAAQIMTLPFILVIFGLFPTLATVANLLSAPLIPLAMLLTTVAGVAQMVSPVLGMVLSVPAEIILSYFVAVATWLSAPTWAQIDVKISTTIFIGIYISYILLTIYVWRRVNYNFRAQSIVD